MKIIAASIGLCLGLLLTAPAYAGPCSIEIETLTQALAGTGADTSPGQSGTAAMPKAPTSAGDLPADPLEPAQPPKATGGDTMPKAPSTAGAPPSNPLEPTAQGSGAEGSKVADPGTMQDGGSMAAGSTTGDDAAASLQRARELDQAGDEASCMAEIAKTKELIGTQ